MSKNSAGWTRAFAARVTRSGARRAAALLIAAGFVTAMAAGLSAQQQAPLQTPAIPGLATRLDDRHVLFRALIDREPPVTGAEIEAGRLVAVGGSQQGGAGMACVTCHGADGAGDGGAAFPRLAALPAWYMYKQLRDYAAGTRPNNIMSPIAKQLTDEEMRTVSQYYAVLDAPYPPQQEAISADRLQWGGQLAAVGSVEKGIPACVNCHGGQGFGAPPSVPYLSGQHAEYMVLQLQLWREGVRKNDPMNVMAAIAQKMTGEDIQAVSQYYARIRPFEVEGARTAAAGVQPQAATE